MKRTKRALGAAICAAAFLFATQLSCGSVTSDTDAGSAVDAVISAADAPPGTPDAPVGTPDAPPGTPDAAPGDAGSSTCVWDTSTWDGCTWGP